MSVTKSVLASSPARSSIGSGQGAIKGGRHVMYKEGTPTANLHVAMLNKAGIPTESFGGELGMSTGELDLSREA